LELQNFFWCDYRQLYADLETFFEFLSAAGVESIYQMNKEHIVSYQKELFYLTNRYGRSQRCGKPQQLFESH